LAGEWKSNNLLSRLSPNDLQLLVGHLRPLRAPANSILFDQGQDVQTVYFPCGNTLASFVITLEDGTAVETTMVGREGAVGGIVSQGRLPAFSRTMVQAGGDFVTLAVAALDAAKLQSRTLDNLFARYADCMLAQIFQSTACNAAHNIEQRAAKWVIAAMERTSSDEVPLTQDRLSSLLGVGRSYVSRVIGRLKAEGILGVRRGHVLVHDRDRLMAKSCACNHAVKQHFDIVLEGIYPDSGQMEADMPSRAAGSKF
jgi:biotin operon repressor